jgi:putative intracellular protease/amidase
MQTKKVLLVVTSHDRLGDTGTKTVARGTKMAGFTKGEEASIQRTEVVPFLTEDLRERPGGDYQKGDDWTSFAVVEGALITGQNPRSAQRVGEKHLAMLSSGS